MPDDDAREPSDAVTPGVASAASSPSAAAAAAAPRSRLEILVIEARALKPPSRGDASANPYVLLHLEKDDGEEEGGGAPAEAASGSMREQLQP